MIFEEKWFVLTTLEIKNNIFASPVVLFSELVCRLTVSDGQL